jgi:hypothetical protein
MKTCRRIPYAQLAEIVDALQDTKIETVSETHDIPVEALETLTERLLATNPRDIINNGLLLEYDATAREATQELMESARKKGVEINGFVVQEAELKRLMEQSNATAEKYKDIPPGDRPRRPATESYPPIRQLRKPRGPDKKLRKQRGPVCNHMIKLST